MLTRNWQRLSVAALAAAGLWAQAARDANSNYQTPEGRRAVARGLGSPNRDERQKPRQLVKAMDLGPGMVVADVGTGVGYMLPFLSRAVGKEGRVLAQDIFDDFLQGAREKAEKEDLANVTFIKGEPDDPRLPENAVDVILALDSYHHYDYPEKMLAAFHKALRPGGRLAVVEFYRRPNAMPNGRAMKHIRADQPEVVREIESGGFRLVSSQDHIKDSQYLAIFEKK